MSSTTLPPDAPNGTQPQAPITPDSIPTIDELIDPQTLADMSSRERRKWEKALRWQRRIARYEAKRQGPQPKAPVHRIIITFLMMAAMLFLVYLLVFTGPGSV